MTKNGVNHKSVSGDTSDAQRLYEMFRDQSNELELALLLHQESHFDLEQSGVDKKSVDFIASAELLSIYQSELSDSRSKEMYYELLLKNRQETL